MARLLRLPPYLPANTRPARHRSAALRVARSALAGACVLACHAPRAAAPERLPAELTAREVRSTLDRETVAEGEVLLRQGNLTLSADTLRYLAPTQWVRASGHVNLTRDGDRFGGTEAEFNLVTRQGFVLQAEYHIERTGAGGKARRIDFVGDKRLTARRADYTSCTPDGGGTPDWILSADKIDLDFENNEGVARNAVLRFLGVPILAAPVISFPATSERKSGWLPPTFDTDSRAGVSMAVPYYWNLAPNYDLMTTPSAASRRGFGLDAELRYLQPSDQGRFEVHAVPDDRVAERSRSAYEFQHSGHFDQGWRYDAFALQASDDDYWKDFANQLPSLTRRLLTQSAQIDRHFDTASEFGFDLYARVQGWQVLQDTVAAEAILPPYQRVPQLGVRGMGGLPGAEPGHGLQWELELEANRFMLADRPLGDDRPDGSRVHMIGALSLPFDEGWGWLTPRASFNAASYRTDQPMSETDLRTSAHRVIPTLSADAGLRFDRDTSLFGYELRQTLEPRLHYVNTPWRDQTNLPLFDTAPSDFNPVSIYADNPFSGVDRVADAHQVTIGATTRWLEPASGIERLRLGAAQRFLFRDQRLTPEDAPSDRRVSDLILFGSGSLWQDWIFDATVQYGAAIDKAVRSIVSVRYQPAPFHTLSGTYRFARGLSEQFELGWQWPLYRGEAKPGGGACQGTLYGVGRVNYSTRDHRVTDALAGFEYDAGCWIARIVYERDSTGLQESTTHWMLQLELVGLSRLGSNPLKALKDNIPGYRLLRDDDAATPSTTTSP